MKISKITKVLLGATILSISQSAFSFGLLEHIAAYSAAGVATHEIEKSIDKNDKQAEYNNSNNHYNTPKQYGNNTYTKSATSNSGYTLGTPYKVSTQSDGSQWK